jgi:hypothetical protein
MKNLKERLELEFEILEKIGRSREETASPDFSEDLERAIIEKELAELEEQSCGQEVLVLRRKRRA